MKRYIFVLSFVCLFVFAFSLPAFAQKSDTIRVGVFLPMTGGVAAYGQEEWEGIQVAHQMQPTVLGRKVELFLVDEKSDRIEAANAVSRLIQNNKAVAILGSATSSNTMAGSAVAEKAKIPMISPTATDPRVVQNKKFMFRVCFTDSFQGEVAAKYVYNNLKARRAAMLIDQAQDYSVDLGKIFEKSFTKLGGKVVITTYCRSGDQDFSAQLASIKKAKADVLYLPNYYTEDALICRQAAETGLKIKIMSADGAQNDVLLKVGGKAVEGFALTGHFDKEGATTKLARAFLKTFKEKYKKDSPAFSALGADSYFLLIDAIKRANSTDGQKVRDQLARTKKFQAVSGIINIGQDGNAVKSAVILQVKDGRFQYLTTVNP